MSVESGGIMNESLKMFLKGLGDSNAEDIYMFLDGDPGAIELMKEIIAESHTKLDVVRP